MITPKPKEDIQTVQETGALQASVIRPDEELLKEFACLSLKDASPNKNQGNFV